MSLNQLLQDIGSVVSSRQLITGDAVAERATSYWDAAPTQAIAIVKPRSTQELAAVMERCYAAGQPVVTQGGLTGCVSGAVASTKEIIVSLEDMNAIESIDATSRTATVQAGVVLENLQHAANERGLCFPLDFGARGSCTVGGNIATNAGGINVLRYGMTRALVLGLEVVTANGKVLSSMSPMLKNNAGYDLKQLFIGSEGTLGIVTRAVVRLFPAPTTCNTALLACDDFPSVIKVLNTLQAGLAGTLSAFEVMWNAYYRGVTLEGTHRAPIDAGQPYYVVVEAEGDDAASDAARFEQLLVDAMEQAWITDAIVCKSESERREVWDIRENFEDILPAYLYDVSLPINVMEAYVIRLEQRLLKRWSRARCIVMGHIADGNLHLFIQTGEDGDHHFECDEMVYHELKDTGGSVSAEHGIGTEKMSWLSLSRSAEELEIMATLKETLDPKGILNPGRVLPKKY